MGDAPKGPPLASSLWRGPLDALVDRGFLEETRRWAEKIAREGVFTAAARAEKGLEHWQQCFDVQTRKCVCPIENREARVKQAAPQMEAMLRWVHQELVDMRSDSATDVAALLATLDEAPRG